MGLLTGCVVGSDERKVWSVWDVSFGSPVAQREQKDQPSAQEEIRFHVLREVGACRGEREKAVPS